MADREIRLIGSFQDDITPKLNRLNRQLLGTLKQFERLQSKIAPVAAEMARFNSAAAATSGSLKSQRSAIEENIRMLRQYRTELSKAATAQTRMGSIRPPRVPRGGGGGTGGITPRGGGSRGGRGGGGYGGGGVVGGAVFGATIGNQLSGLITNAITAGFQMGAKILMTPFQLGAQALGERIQDEMSDVRAAGGLFSISQQQKSPFFKTFADAEAYTKEQNRYLAKLAGSLPGDTMEYIQVAKQISDGIFTIIANDKVNSLKLGEKLAAERGATSQELARFQAGGQLAMQQTGKEMIGEMTKLTVLAGLGGRQGAYGLPQLTERMFSEDKVNMGMFQRYAAIFRDPMIKGALERNVANINATAKSTAARYEALRKTFSEIVTPDLVRRYQRTTAGVLESLKTTFLNPEVGLLGLGRPLSKMALKFNEFGQMVDKNNNATTNLSEAMREQLSIFDYLRDIFANISIVLMPILDSLALLFDPFQKLGLSLEKIRELTMQFQLSFERYREGFMKVAEGMNGEAKELFKASIPARAAFMAVNNALLALGAYGRGDFDRLTKMINDPTRKVEEFGSILQEMIDKFLGSDAAYQIGAALGSVIGTIVAQVGEIMKAAAGLATGSKLAQGFSAGFQAAGGIQGFSDIIRSVFHLFAKLLIEVIKAAPLESAIAAALFFLPGAIAALVGEAVTGGFARALGGGAGGGGRGGGGKGGGGGLGGVFLTPAMARRAEGFKQGMKTATAPLGPVAMTLMGGTPGRALIRQKGWLGGAARKMARIGKVGKGIAGAVPGGALAFGAVDAGLRLAQGEKPGMAIGGAAASTIGAIIGAGLGSIVPGLGTAIGAAAGGIIGGFVGDYIFNAAVNAFSGPSKAQQEAAAAQKAAAEAAVTKNNIAGVDTQFNLGTIAQLQARLQSAGLYTPPTAADAAAGKFGGGGPAAGFFQAYQFRNVALEAAKRAAEDLQATQQRLKDAVPPDIAEKTLKPLRDKAQQTAAFATAQEKVLAAAFNKMPKSAQDALVKNIANMPNFPISMAIADVIRKTPVQPVQLQYPNPGTPFGFSTPSNPLGFPTPSNPLVIPPFSVRPPGSAGKNGKPEDRRAFGGPVSANKMYMVGERGPELFMSGSTGRVIPNSALGGTSVTVGTINVNGANAREIADEVANELLTAMYRKSRSEVLTS